MAEVMAASYGVEVCLSMGFNNIDMELDSEIITDMLLNRGNANLKLKEKIDCIVENLEGKKAEIRHCFREANQDLLVSYLLLID
ncbi:hypothetical protein HAX54_041370 [Datura stramonium]|uniref:RNase H type-1 domain-containing protein n=1 Tax=Datura stramonium TaxID=4076 RepID=A0ABS8VT61_DATST|nr:hypothetical protein [Datura stramonium]